jgi:hypothetical protein
MATAGHSHGARKRVHAAGGVAKGADDGACRGCRWEPTGPNVWSDGIAANQDSRLGMYSLR